MIFFNGLKCVVIENFGFNHDAGVYAKLIWYKGEKQVVCREDGSRMWTFYKPQFEIGSRPHGMARETDK
jgi:hypothetical protein